MKAFKAALYFFALLDGAFFLVAQIQPRVLAEAVPAFAIESGDAAYTRLVGMLFLTLGVLRLCGSLFSEQKLAFQLMMLSWAIELFYFLTAFLHGRVAIADVIPPIVIVTGMLLWSVRQYRAGFGQSHRP